MARSSVWSTAALLALCACAAAPLPAAEPFTFAQVQATARQLAAAPQVTPPRVSDAWFALDYDRYRMIAARHENALWRDTDSPFWAEFFAAGMVYEYPVQIHVVDDQGNVETLKPDDRWFQFRGETAPLATLPGGGFSGVRLLADEPGEQHKTEFMVFQGASYFRARGAGQVYGSSARGLAIDIGLGTPEEFPRFLELWLNKPAAGASQASVWALMNSPAVTGAYKFSIAPGASAAIDVEAHLWFRHGVQKVGIAPLTSMWMWDDDASRLNGDPRPEVHDSDGLLIQEGARHWTWRPLVRPEIPRVTEWRVPRLEGFGLLQRDRDEAHYSDAEAHYHRRPSLWVTPAAPWGPGRIELLELPSRHEGGDNIGAYWVSDARVAAGTNLVLNYRVTFGQAPPQPKDLGQVVASRVVRQEDGVLVEIEFAQTEKSSPTTPLTPRAACDAGTISEVALVAESEARQMLRFRYSPPSQGGARLHAQLTTSAGPASEQWSYRWTP